MTLLELSVVIMVMLTLISLLFIAARVWKQGSDRAANVMNLRNTQQAMRGHQNLNNLREDAPFTVSQLEEFMKMPEPPNDNITYEPLEIITDIGVLWLNPQDGGVVGARYGPEVGQTDDW